MEPVSSAILAALAAGAAAAGKDTASQATKQTKLGGIKDLLAGAKRGDVLVFTNSSHGLYQSDTDGDESGCDALLCPDDVMANVVDDKFRGLLSALLDGISLPVILDSCFSGTGTRVALYRRVPDDRRDRFLNPRHLGLLELRPTQVQRSRTKRLDTYAESQMKDILLSAARDRQHATEAMIEVKYYGAMTYFACQIIEDAGYQITYRALGKRLRDLIAVDYSQDLQPEGKDANKQRLIFT